MDDPEQTVDPAADNPSALCRIVDEWFLDWIYGSSAARDTAIFNHIFAAKEDLKRRLAKEM